MSASLLSVQDVGISFGGNVALDSVSIHIDAGEFVGLIGPNGSGKSTLVNVISGFYRPGSGSVQFDGADVTGMAPRRLRARGVVRTFQNLRIFDDLTVLENVLVGNHLEFNRHPTLSFAAHVLGLPAAARQERKARDIGLETLDVVGLADVAELRGGSLSYGQKKRLELARALMGETRLLLLDEPTAGLSATEADDMIHLFSEQVRSRGLAVALIEHRLDWIMGLSDRVYVLDAGRVIADGTPAEVRSSPEVIAAYIGSDSSADELVAIDAVEVTDEARKEDHVDADDR